MSVWRPVLNRTGVKPGVLESRQGVNQGFKYQKMRAINPLVCVWILSLPEKKGSRTGMPKL